MRNFWNNLNERERWMVGIGSLFALFYLFYLLLYSPLTTAVSNKTAQLSEKQQTLTWMQQVRQQPKKQKVQQSISNAKLLTLIGNQLGTGSLRIFPYQLQQTSSGDIQLSYELVPFNYFLSWLWTLNNNYAIVLKQFSAERTPTAGVVKLQIVITAK
ncbi:type II secretion system protein GspM [Legionella feeleii]|uniref:General secretion pathway protein M n=1 Tax=Legionella feeleii TaxID=453 RepID=A0A378IV27_9GAMM|nr:type II secretion system protein GspM [Legionella feeleii]STX39098.1 general secretion pathway protein M [Legionella feeleii]